MNVFKKYPFLKPAQGFFGCFFIYRSYGHTKMALQSGVWAPLNTHNAACKIQTRNFPKTENLQLNIKF